MIKYEQITPRQAAELLFIGRIRQGLCRNNQRFTNGYGNVNWFMRISGIENGS